MSDDAAPQTLPSSRSDAPVERPFWETTTLEAMTSQQWESLCDGCGRCCLVKLQDADDNSILATDVGCVLFDATTCRCHDYANRSIRIPDCVTLTPKDARELEWLPPTCAYRLLAKGDTLKWWHPLVSGTGQTVIEAGISVKGRVVASEDDVPESDLPLHIVKWPLRWPRQAR